MPGGLGFATTTTSAACFLHCRTEVRHRGTVSDCGFQNGEANTTAERRALGIALLCPEVAACCPMGPRYWAFIANT